MKSKGRREKASERRRKLAEINLLTEPRAKLAPSRRGCALPFFGSIVALLAATAGLWGHAL
jgi:hypothetical protein